MKFCPRGENNLSDIHMTYVKIRETEKMLVTGITNTFHHYFGMII